MPEPQPLEIYLNDHLAGATGACEVARNAADKLGSTSHGPFLREFVSEVEEDRALLEEMLRSVGAAPNPVKQAGAWIMEKVSRFKLSGTGSEDLSALLALETLCIGVDGKICLWTALKEVAGEVEAVAAYDLDALLARAEQQRTGLEQERRKAARAALRPTVGAGR